MNDLTHIRESGPTPEEEESMITLRSNPFEFDINTYHKANMLAAPKRSVGGQVPHIVCADGFTMSVQASSYHYSNPAEDSSWPYASFEVGYPSRVETLLLPYGHLTVDENDPNGEEEVLSDVYGWVPADVINEIVRIHGGYRHE